MRTFLIMALAMAYLGGTLISVTIEGNYVGADTTSALTQAMRPPFVDFSNPLTAVGGFFMVAWTYIQALWAMFWWDYSFFEGSWAILKYVGRCASIAMVASVVLAIRGTGST